MMRKWLVVGLAASGWIAAACSGDETTTPTTTGSGATGASTSSHGGETSQGGTSSEGGAGAQAGGASQGGETSTGGGPAGGAGQGGQTVTPLACDEPNPDGAELVELVNAYRQSEGLPAIPYSPSLSCVAVTHVHDLADNSPHTEPGGCNLHSWSDQGPWTACCYTPDHAQAQCMWSKPQELTEYPGNGYENAASGAGSPAAALAMWQGSTAHNEVILNLGIWESHPWNAVGAGLYQGYATLWFGEQSDPAR
jgi:uncharacterized protein YkwD